MQIPVTIVAILLLCSRSTLASEVMRSHTNIEYPTTEEQIDRFAAPKLSSNTKLSGEVIFSVTGIGGENKAGATLGRIDNNLIFNNRVRLNFNTSFSDRDLLKIRLQSGNVPNLKAATGTNMSRLSFDGNTQNKTILNQLSYRFPIGKSAQFTRRERDVVPPRVYAEGRLRQQSLFSR